MGTAGTSLDTVGVSSSVATTTGMSGAGGMGMSSGGAGGGPLPSDAATDVAPTIIDSSSGDVDHRVDSGARDASQDSRGCIQPTECPIPSSQCQTASCTNGVCGTTSLPAGTAPKQTRGDCRRVDCTANGLESIVVDDTDFDDGNECTKDTCANGMYAHTVVPSTRCANGAKLCDPTGACVDCVVATDCPGVVTECNRKLCTGGHCSTGPRPSGEFCNGFADQCDGNGNCIDCVNNGGCNECCVCLQNTCVAASYGK